MSNTENGDGKFSSHSTNTAEYPQVVMQVLRMSKKSPLNKWIEWRLSG